MRWINAEEILEQFGFDPCNSDPQVIRMAVEILKLRAERDAAQKQILDLLRSPEAQEWSERKDHSVYEAVDELYGKAWADWLEEKLK